MTREEFENLNAELRCLDSSLKFDSEYGDYKITKIKEYELLGLECPYSKEVLEDYHSKRNSMRTRIDEIRELLKGEIEDEIK